MLAELQRDFRDWLVAASDETANRLGHRAGLSIYQNNYRSQLVGCLEASLPLLRQYLGDTAFLQTAVHHIDRHPPHAWTLDAYVHNFDRTLIERFPDNPDVHELAWLETALARAFVGADATPLRADILADIDWESTRLNLVPTFAGRTINTNVDDIWTALSAEEAPPEAAMLDEPAGLIVWRKHHTCQLKRVDAVEWEALQHIRATGNFTTLCERLAKQLGDEAGIAMAGALLANWLANELIVAG